MTRLKTSSTFLISQSSSEWCNGEAERRRRYNHAAIHSSDTEQKKQPRNSDGMTLTENSIIALRRAFAAASNANFFLQLVYGGRIYSQFQLHLSPVLSTGVDNLKSPCVGSDFF